MSKKSIIDAIRKYVDETPKSQVPDHVLIAVELDDDGVPTATAVNAKGRPFTMIGMLDLIIRKAEENKEEVHEKIERAESGNNGIKDMPQELQDKLRDLENRAREAARNESLGELFAIKEEAEKIMRDFVEKHRDDSEDKKDDDSDPSNFTLGDFKNL